MTLNIIYINKIAINCYSPNKSLKDIEKNKNNEMTLILIFLWHCSKKESIFDMKDYL